MGRSSTVSSLTTKRFTGQYHESAIPGGEGLSYYNARWYDAKLGRFTSADTIVPRPANPQALNRYAYVVNNPLKYQDPSGNRPAPVIPSTDITNWGSWWRAAACFFNSCSTVSGRTYAYPDPMSISVGPIGTAGTFGRVGLNYADEAVSGISEPLQKAIVKTAGDLEDGLVIGFRGRAPGSSMWDWILPSKTAIAKTITEGGCGFRTCSYGPNNELIGSFVSDLDGAFAMFKNGQLVDNEFFEKQIGRRVNAFYGWKVVNHGDHANGFFAKVDGASLEKFVDDTAYLFTKDGYIGSGRILETIMQLGSGSK